MKSKWMTTSLCLMAVMMIGVSSASARRKHQNKPAPVQLNATGQQLEAQYAATLAKLQAQIKNDLPPVAAQKKSAFLQACEAVKTARKNVETAQAAFHDIDHYKGLVGHAHWWINDAEKQIAKAQAKLKKATMATTRQALKQTIAKQTARRDAGKKALKNWSEDLVKAQKDAPRLNAKLKAAEAALANAKAQPSKALEALGVNALLSSDRLDPQLVKYVVLSQATPRGLAAFAQQGEAQRALVTSLLSNTDLMKQMLIADGPKDNRYGRAMQVYSDIQNASPRASSGCLQRLALATAMVNAVPIQQRNAKDDTTGPAIVNPVKRYQAFEQAYLAGELDPAFKYLTTWDYRFVIDGNAPDQTYAWGRKMLHNYRPDEISINDYKWRYVKAVNTEVQYGSKNNKYDLPSLQFYQNIIKDGGVCGRRAWFGGFILRSFGIPIIRRPERGHASLAHWTPSGWQICLGAGWGWGWTKTRYHDDKDFLADTQARGTGKFLQVKRAQWIGDVMGEKPVYGLHAKQNPAFWYAVSLYRQQQIIQQAGPQKLAPMASLSESQNAQGGKPGKITVSSKGVITIPAAACSKPTKSTGKIQFMPSDLGGMQLHYARRGGPQTFEYTVDAPKAGLYELTAKVVTTSQDQHLKVTANSGKSSADIALPYTIGMWETSQPVQIALVQGHNVLSFTRGDQQTLRRGITIKQFTLKPKY